MECIRRMAMALVLVGLLTLVVPPASTTACSCTEWPTFEQAYLESQAIFRGTVTAIRSAETPYFGLWVTLQVSAWWKGEPPHIVEILTGESEAACGFPFFVGTEYLVYAQLWNQSGPLWTHLCWRTHTTWDEDPDLVTLGPPHPLLVAPQAWEFVKELYR